MRTIGLYRIFCAELKRMFTKLNLSSGSQELHSIKLCIHSKNENENETKLVIMSNQKTSFLFSKKGEEFLRSSPFTIKIELQCVLN